VFSLNQSKTFLKLASVVVFLPVLGLAQEPERATTRLERTISKVSWRKEPIKLVKLQTKGQTVELGKAFSEEDDWLKGLTVTVENVSDKPVAQIVLTLSFPRPAGPSETIPTFTEDISYGRDPSEISGAETEKQILPGEKVDIKLREVTLPAIKGALTQLGYPEKTTHVQISVYTVTFNDGTMWGADTILYPDPTDPKHKINPSVPLSEQLKRPSDQSSLPCKPPPPFFRNVSFRNANAPAKPDSGKAPFAKFLMLQDPTLPCNAVWLGGQSFTCGPSGGGCTY
jgi:hypothetical protein